MRLIDADALKEQIPETRADIFENCRNCNLLDASEVLGIIDEAPTIDNTDAYVRGYNAGVQMSIKLFLSLGGEDDDSIQM